MKIVFAPKELEWLNATTLSLSAVAARRRDDDDGKLMRLAAKMKYKFTPNASYVNLTGRERDLVLDIVRYAKTQLTGLNAVGEEAEVLSSIEGKVYDPY